MQPLHMYLYLTFVAHSYGKRYNLMQKYEKKLDYASYFFHFLYITPPDLTQMFSKSASEELSKWQICGFFGCFCSLTIRKGEIC